MRDFLNVPLPANVPLPVVPGRSWQSFAAPFSEQAYSHQITPASVAKVTCPQCQECAFITQAALDELNQLRVTFERAEIPHRGAPRCRVCKLFVEVQPL